MRCSIIFLLRNIYENTYIMSLAGRDSILRCCRSVVNQASKDARTFYPMRQISTHSSRLNQLSPRSIPRARNAPSRFQGYLPVSHRRSFSVSNAHATKAIINPRKDENGEDMLIEIMPRASHVITRTNISPFERTLTLAASDYMPYPRKTRIRHFASASL